MNIHNCLLNNENDRELPKGKLSDQLKKNGKKRIWDSRSGNIDTVVIHFMSAVEINHKKLFDIDECLQIFLDYDISSHYIIDRQGEIYYLVPEESKAWHAGKSIMPAPDNRKSVNDFSIGIELLATEKSGFADDQYDALCGLIMEIEERWNIKTYTGHEDIAGERAVKMGLREDMKIDPGPLFQWKRIGKTPLENESPIA